MLGTAQRQFPGKCVRLVSKIEALNDFIRFSRGSGGIEGSTLYIAGSGFAVVAHGGRLSPVTDFVDAAPSAA